MDTDPDDSLLTRVLPFFGALFKRDAAGGSWLSKLLSATPYGVARLGELADHPGWLQTQLAVRTANGRLGCFEYPAAPSRDLVAWFVNHPQELVWPEGGSDGSAETVRLRRALIYDDPPGSQRRAQQRARDLMPKRSALSQEWWRFETIGKLDCVLITERLVVTVIGKRTEGLAPASEWYPQRSELVSDLEVARRLADGKRFASLVLSDRLLPDAGDEVFAATLARGAPNLEASELVELHDAYLGNLTWDDARDAVGLPRGSAPESTGELQTT